MTHGPIKRWSLMRVDERIELALHSPEPFEQLVDLLVATEEDHRLVGPERAEARIWAARGGSDGGRIRSHGQSLSRLRTALGSAKK